MKLPVDYDAISSSERRKVREEYVKRQRGLCCYCNKLLDGDVDRHIRNKKITEHLFPPGFFDHPVHLHHDHGTGMTIGAIHSYCNAVSFEYDGV